MSISIECSQSLPRRIFYEHVSIFVKPYIIPPTRCYNCQRYGHGAVSCRRALHCPKCSGSHSLTDCKSESQKCISCKGPHAAHSFKCPFYREALKIAGQTQERMISRDQAARLYAKLYDDTPTIKYKFRSPITPSPQQMNLSQLSQNVQPPLSTNLNFPPPRTMRKPNSQSESLLFSQRSRSVPSTSQATNYKITPGQRISPTPSQGKQSKRKMSNESPIPPHLTQEYADVLKGSTWSGIETIEDDYDDRDDESIPPYQPCQLKPPEENILTILKKLFYKAIQWVINNLLPTSITESPIIAPILQSLTSLFSQA